MENTRRKGSRAPIGVAIVLLSQGLVRPADADDLLMAAAPFQACIQANAQVKVGALPNEGLQAEGKVWSELLDSCMTEFRQMERASFDQYKDNDLNKAFLEGAIASNRLWAAGMLRNKAGTEVP